MAAGGLASIKVRGPMLKQRKNFCNIAQYYAIEKLRRGGTSTEGRKLGIQGSPEPSVPSPPPHPLLSPVSDLSLKNIRLERWNIFRPHPGAHAPPH